jgi:hypothetical protein
MPRDDLIGHFRRYAESNRRSRPNGYGCHAYRARGGRRLQKDGLPSEPARLNLEAANVTSVLWATGYRLPATGWTSASWTSRC